MLPFWIALQFLSSLPVRLPGMPAAEQMGRSLLFYPVVGLLFGVLLWAFDSLLAASPLLLHAALLLTLWVLLSGALHLDGLADSADAWLGGFGDRERTLTIMKDPAQRANCRGYPGSGVVVEVHGVAGAGSGRAEHGVAAGASDRACGHACCSSVRLMYVLAGWARPWPSICRGAAGTSSWCSVAWPVCCSLAGRVCRHCCWHVLCSFGCAA